MNLRAGIRWERAVATRAALVEVARRLFATQGYHCASTPDVVSAAGVTRGALYHHFKQKEDLFEAVVRETAHQLEQEATAAVLETQDPWLRLQSGLQVYLRLVAGNRETQRVLLIDGPAVLGWIRWREIQSEYTFGHLVRSLDELVLHGVISPQPREPLAHLLLAALNDAAMSIANSADPEAARALMGQALETLVTGLRVKPQTDRP
jgi:AcrR family transcriptional regulator